jgi:hypothetical protein
LFLSGAIVNGNRIDISKNNLKLTKQRPNTSFTFSTFLNTESTNQFPEMNIPPHQPIIIPTASQPSNLPSYQAIETAYLEHGIRIRLNSTKTSQQFRGKSANNLQRHSSFINGNPSRTSSVLNYRTFSVLQQTSLSDFAQTHAHNVSFDQLSQKNEEIHNNHYSPSITNSENLNPITPSEKLLLINDIISTKTLHDNDPDLAYMSSLLKKSSGDSYRGKEIRKKNIINMFYFVRHNSSTSWSSRNIFYTSTFINNGFYSITRTIYRKNT